MRNPSTFQPSRDLVDPVGEAQCRALDMVYGYDALSRVGVTGWGDDDEVLAVGGGAEQVHHRVPVGAPALRSCGGAPIRGDALHIKHWIMRNYTVL